MPHQRHGHTSFVWDPRNAVLTGSGVEEARGARQGGGLPDSSAKRCAGERVRLIDARMSHIVGKTTLLLSGPMQYQWLRPTR